MKNNFDMCLKLMSSMNQTESLQIKRAKKEANKLVKTPVIRIKQSGINFAAPIQRI